MHNGNNDILRSEARYRRLTETPVPRLVLSLAVPTIISMAYIAVPTVVICLRTVCLQVLIH